MSRTFRTDRAGSRPWRAIRWVVALILSGMAAWLSIRQIDWTALQTILAHPRWLLLALALGTVLATTVAKAVRWHVLLRSCGAQIGGIRVLRVLLIGQLGNSFLPARLGDVARAMLAGPQTSGGFLAAMGTILAEKALDGAMGLLILLGLALWTPLPGWLRGPLLGLALLTGGLLAVLVLASTKRKWATQLYGWLSGWLPAAGQIRASRLLAQLGMGLGLFSQPASALLALTLSAAVWGLAALTNVVTLAALDIDAPAWSTWLVLVTGYAANFLPTVPAQVGVFEYACVLALTAAGVGQEPSLAFGLVLHLLVYGPPAVLGAASMAFEGLNWTRLKEAQSGYMEDDHVPI